MNFSMMRMTKPKETSDEVKEIPKRLLAHEWMDKIFEAKQKNDEWRKMKDGAVKQQWHRMHRGVQSSREKKKVCIKAIREEKKKK